MLNGVGTNISMAYTSKYNNKSTGDKGYRVRNRK